MISEPLNTRVPEYFRSLQHQICLGLGSFERERSFSDERWAHPVSGGGSTRVLEGGDVFERAGVNFSEVTTPLPASLAERLGTTPQKAFATGISLVLHPRSPMVPAVHMNLRYFELENGDRWFGGGADLTPSYLFREDASHFHATFKTACDRHHPDWYPRFKQWCDEYFLIRHRNETRGVGGIFFDYLRDNPEETFAFVMDVGDAFLHSYIPIVERRMPEPWSPAEREWQLLRRGRYVEFNLVYDRGTLFGLETGGRIESILMSLPPEVRWTYDHTPPSGSREAELLEILKHPRTWV